MDTAKIFQNGRRQAVRLPRECRFEGTEVLIKRVGNAVVLLPYERSWETLFSSCAQFETGFTLTREQPEAQQKHATLLK